MLLLLKRVRVVSYFSKTNALVYEYQLCHADITRTTSIKNLRVFFDLKYIFTIMLISHFPNS
jgi:hypothetical protein